MAKNNVYISVLFFLRESWVFSPMPLLQYLCTICTENLSCVFTTKIVSMVGWIVQIITINFLLSCYAVSSLLHMICISEWINTIYIYNVFFKDIFSFQLIFHVIFFKIEPRFLPVMYRRVFVLLFYTPRSYNGLYR